MSDRSESGQKRCPHCLGTHYGQRFDDCVYVKLANDETATPEQRENARSWLRAANCAHDRLDEEGICRNCGEDRRGI